MVGLSLRPGIGLLGFLGYLWWRGQLPTVTVLRSENSRWHLLAGVMNTLFLLSYYVALEIAPASVVYPII